MFNSFVTAWTTTCQAPLEFPRGFQVHGVSQARQPEWIPISFSGDSSWPRDWTLIFCIGRKIFYYGATKVTLILVYIKLKGFGIAKEMIKKQKTGKLAYGIGNNILNQITGKDLLSKVYKELVHYNAKKIIQLLRNGQRIWIDSFPKKIYKGPISTSKNAEYHQPSGKYQSKPQWNTISHPAGWLYSKR